MVTVLFRLGLTFPSLLGVVGVDVVYRFLCCNTKLGNGIPSVLEVLILVVHVGPQTPLGGDSPCSLLGPTKIWEAAEACGAFAI